MVQEIIQLSTEIANQIAAGEVIENPAAVIKELVENAVDSGANAVTVTVENAGRSYIAVEDNGTGIASDQLPKLILRHATSKIRSMQDLYACRSMGFRGEALASISSVSRFRVRSRTASDDVAWQLFCEGDSTDDVQTQPYESPCSIGTVVEVRDLFFRVPARQKFLGNDAAEMRKIKDVIKKMVLAHPQVAITLKSTDKTLLSVDACSDIQDSRKRLEAVFGNDFANQAFYIDQTVPWGRIQGWCAKPGYNRRYADMQVFLLNHRPMRDKKLSFALKRAYMDVMLPGRHAAFCLYLEMDPMLVDINVHPSKDEARFSNLDEITRSLKYTVSQALSQLDQPPEDNVNLVSRVTFEQQKIQDPLLMPAAVEPQAEEPEFRSRPVSVSNIQTVKQPVFSDVKKHCDAAQPAPVHQSSRMNHLPAKLQWEEDADEYTVPPRQVCSNVKADPSQETLTLGYALGQLHGIYVLAQSQKGLVVVDMHAAHERIVYEQLKCDYADQGVATQKLLVPYVCQKDVVNPDVVEEFGLLLLQMGLELSVKEGQVVLESIPALLSKKDLNGLLQDVTSELLAYQDSDHVQTSLNKIFATMACHSAIRANRKLSLSEMNELLRQIEKTANSDYCNHGRPTWFLWDLSRIDAVFRRGQ